MNYKDVTHADFKSKRSTNPLSPSYVIRNDLGKTEEIGPIEGNSPMGIPERKKGPVSTSLDTQDIEGAKTSTKGLGVFAHHQRTGFNKTNRIDDIAGSTVGSLKKGPTTNRVSNPLNPDYVIPGYTEYKDNNGFGVTGKQVMEGTQHLSQTQKPQRQTKANIKMQPNVNRDRFKQDMNQFYGTEDKNFADIDFNKLYKATKDPKTGTKGPKMPENLQNDDAFKRNSKKFYNQSQTSGSEYNYEQNRFYEDTMQKRETDPNKFQNMGKGTGTNKIATPDNGQHFKRDQAKFWGESYVPSDKSSDRGSIFQQNAAEFYGMDKPPQDESQFRVSKNQLSDPNKNQPKQTSVLNEMKLKEHERNMQRDPKFGKNLRKFWEMKSVATNSNFASSNKSYAQQLDNFIAK